MVLDEVETTAGKQSDLSCADRNLLNLGLSASPAFAPSELDQISLKKSEVVCFLVGTIQSLLVVFCHLYVQFLFLICRRDLGSQVLALFIV